MPKDENETPLGCLLVGRNDLFGARMLPFINALRIGHDYNLPVRIHWPVTDGDPTNIGEYADVFSDTFLEKHFIDESEFHQLTKRAVRLNPNKPTSPQSIIDTVTSGGIVALNGTAVTAVLDGEDPLKVNQSYRATLDRISFTPLVASNIQRIKEATKGRSFLAYHVRHGDVTSSYRAKNKPWTNKFVPSEFFEQHYKNHIKTNAANALVFGDFQPSLDWLCARCEGLQKIGNVIEFGKLGSLQRDFLELYAMSRADLIVGPKNSGFSQLAASLGGVAFHDIMKSLHWKDRNLAFEQLFQRISEFPESLSSDGEIGQCMAHLGQHLVRTDQNKKLVNLLTAEIKRGNKITFLFPLLARAQFELKDYHGVLETRQKSVKVPLFGANSVADLDAITAQASFHLGDKAEALRLLCVAVYHTPYSSDVARAYELLSDDGLINAQTFFPMDDVLFKLIAKGANRFKPAIFAWEWRHSLISNFQRPLTIAGAADQFIKSMQKAVRKLKLSTIEKARFDSFQALVLMGLGKTEEALSMSINAVDMAPNDPFVLKRHVQNLLVHRDYEHGLRFAKVLVECHPNIPMYKLLLAECYLGLRKRKRAVEVYDEITSSNLSFLGGTLAHATVLNTLKRHPEAEELLNRVLPETRWPDRHLEAFVNAKVALGSEMEILPFLQELHDESFSVRKISHLLAKIKMVNGDLDGAERDVNTGIQFSPNLIRFKELLARVYLAQGRTEEAAKAISALPAQMQKRFK